MRLAFKLRSLERRTARAPAGTLRALERAFAYPELRACYCAPATAHYWLILWLPRSCRLVASVPWRCLPSSIEVALPLNIGDQIAEARKTHHRFGQFAAALDQIRLRIESAPVEKADLQKLCAGLGIPGDLDVALITWRPDYDAFYYRQLSKRARRLFLFRSEYIFDLERAVIVERA